MDETIDWLEYRFWVISDEFQENTIHIRVFDPSFDHGFPVFHLTLGSLWTREGEHYSEGDYYQDVMNKEKMVAVNKKISYAALVHDFLLSNLDRLLFIKNIYSSSLNGHPLEAWTPSESSRNFWEKQLKKNIGVEFDGDRYKLKIRD